MKTLNLIAFGWLLYAAGCRLEFDNSRHCAGSCRTDNCHACAAHANESNALEDYVWSFDAELAKEMFYG